MKPKLALSQRERILHRVFNGEPIAQVARDAGISRGLLYRWLKRSNTTIKSYKNSKNNASKIEAAVMPLKGSIVKRPHYSVRVRIQAVEDYLHHNKSVSDICKELLISRTILFRWIKKYQTAGRNVILRAVPDKSLATASTRIRERSLDAVYTEPAERARDDKQIAFNETQALSSLEDKKPVIETYPNQVIDRYVELILNAVSEYPELSSHKLVEILPRVGNRPVVGHHGVQNVLRRHDLTTYEKRLEYSLSNKRKPFVFNQIMGWVLQILVRFFHMPLAARSKMVAFVSAFSIPVILSISILGTYNYLQIFIQAPSLVTSIGYVFASGAIVFGIFFLLYSAKYYISIALVLAYSRQSLAKQGKDIVLREGGRSQASGLVPDVSHVSLERQPFVSIHLPMYNEKRVVNRLLEAVTSMNYENYEVIVCDDSTDETKEIVYEWKNHPRIKISHRDTRSGFKGAALQKALEVMNPKTEFVIVFDADFMPFPDTIEQFLRYFKSITGSIEQRSYAKSKIAALQGYQWHVLNKSENWLTRGVRTEYAGSYIIERSSNEIYGGLKQIAGSVYMIRADVLKKFGWGNSITEDFELTLRLYAQGYQVVYTPYIQAPSECVSTIKRLIRQRMRWAEGHSFNVKKMFWPLLLSSTTSSVEKFEFLYLVPYYLQSFFFLVGTGLWFTSEAIFQVRLPFWTEVWGWSLVLTNMFSLPLMNTVGMFLEEAEEKDYMGVLSFLLLTYIVAPFQAYAAVKGFLEQEEGPWFRTPKTGRITDVFRKGKLYRWLSGFFPSFQPSESSVQTQSKPAFGLSLQKAVVRMPRRNSRKWFGDAALALTVSLSIIVMMFAPYITTSEVQASERKFGTIQQGKENQEKESISSAPKKIDGQLISQYGVGTPNQIDYIFHPEPRIRVKHTIGEIELEFLGVSNKKIEIGDSFNYQGEYTYDIGSGNNKMELVYTPSAQSLKEELILNSYQDIKSVDYDVKLVGFTIASHDGEVYFAPDSGGESLFRFEKPFIFEKNHPEQRIDIEYQLEKNSRGYILKKIIGIEAQQWLANPSRNYPVVIDPTLVTSVIQAAITAAESQYDQQKKIIWANGALNGDAWYVVYNDAASVKYEKCVPSVDGCEANGDWTDATDIDGGDADNYNPSVWWENDQKKVWIAWGDNSRDNLEFRYIDVDASDPGTQGALCNGPDQSNHNPSGWFTSIAVADSSGATDDIFLTYVSTSTGSVNNIYRVDISTLDASTCSVTWNSILSNSGVDAADRPSAVAIGDDLHLIFQDGTSIKHSVSNNDGGTEWDRADYDITAAAADNSSIEYEVASDGSDIWLFIDKPSGNGTELWQCASCSSSTTWTSLTAPFTAENDTNLAIGYASNTDSIYVFANAGATLNVSAKSSPVSSISWSETLDLGAFGASTAIVSVTSVLNSSSDEGIAVLLRDATNSELEFSTVPENMWVTLALLPFVGKIRRRLKKCAEKRI